MFRQSKEEQRLLDEVNDKFLPRRVAMGVSAAVLALSALVLGVRGIDADTRHSEIEEVSCQFEVSENGTYQPDFESRATLAPDEKVQRGIASCDREIPADNFVVTVAGGASCTVIQRRTEYIRGSDTVHPDNEYRALIDCR